MLQALIPMGIGLLGSLFGKKKPTQYAPQESPQTQAARQQLYTMLQAMMKQGPAGMGLTQNANQILMNRFFPQQQMPMPMVMPRGASAPPAGSGQRGYMV